MTEDKGCGFSIFDLRFAIERAIADVPLKSKIGNRQSVIGHLSFVVGHRSYHHTWRHFLFKLFSLVFQGNGELTRFVKFATVGAIGAVVDFGVLNLLVLGVGMPKEYANLISVSCAILSNFTWNRLWTFPESRERPLHTQFGMFALVNVIGLGINQIVFLTTDEFVFQYLFPHPIDYNFAKATAIIIVLFWNFFVNRNWTYRGIA